MRDPEGILSTIPAIGTALLGSIAGQWLQSRRGKIELVRGLALAGLSGIAVGLIWATVFPLNKKLWTSSYVLFTGGIAAVLLAVAYWAVEVRGRRGPARPFAWLGSNPLAIFVASEMLGMGLTVVKLPGGTTVHDAVYRRLFAPVGHPQLASFLWAAAYVTLWWIIAWAMYRKSVFIKL
jgi:predicted acyltransferase